MSVSCVIPHELVGKKEAVNAIGVFVLAAGITSSVGGPAVGKC